MKGIKIFAASIMMLLGTGIVCSMQNGNESSNISSYYGSSKTVKRSLRTHSHSASGAKSEKNVKCKACHGLGHNAYEPGRRSCSVCNGEGRMKESAMNIRYERWLKTEVPCGICGGTGTSYRGRTEGFMNMDLLAPAGHYHCKVCKGKGKGTRGELMENFRIANEVYGPDL
ncbi:MAG: hypothetical protein K2K98_08685 [Muribaculaceae bacterium]|nr:hypothetical protein [Muribaculaceae bacterium]